jgi:hypothetical protein
MFCDFASTEFIYTVPPQSKNYCKKLSSNPFIFPVQISQYWRGKHRIKSKMEIDPATQGDAGIYECHANNKYVCSLLGVARHILTGQVHPLPQDSYVFFYMYQWNK